jgi:hypothetical protein
MARRLEGTQFVFNIIESSSPPQVKFDIFQRINSGGKHLNNQEIRNCVASKNTRKLLKELVDNQLFRETTGNSISAQRMDDQELALRFIGFTMVEQGLLVYNGGMTSFLNSVVEKLNGLSENAQKAYIGLFNTAMLNCQHGFGPYAFRKCLPEHLKPDARKQAINKSLFTIWSLTLSREDIRPLIKKEELAHIQAARFLQNNEFFQNVTNKTNDKSVIEQSLEEVKSITKTITQKARVAV